MVGSKTADGGRVHARYFICTNYNISQTFLALSQSGRVAGDEEVRYTSWLHGYPVGLSGSIECMSVFIDSGIASELNGWRAENCTQGQSVEVICHKGRLFHRPLKVSFRRYIHVSLSK